MIPDGPMACRSGPDGQRQAYTYIPSGAYERFLSPRPRLSILTQPFDPALEAFRETLGPEYGVETLKTP